MAALPLGGATTHRWQHRIIPSSVLSAALVSNRHSNNGMIINRYLEECSFFTAILCQHTKQLWCPPRFLQAKYMTLMVSWWTLTARAIAVGVRSSLEPDWWLPSPLQKKVYNYQELRKSLYCKTHYYRAPFNFTHFALGNDIAYITGADILPK